MKFHQLLFYKWYRVFEFFEDSETNCKSKAYFNTVILFLLNIQTVRNFLEFYSKTSISTYYIIALTLFVAVFLYRSLVFKNGYMAYKTAYASRSKIRRLVDTITITSYCICSAVAFILSHQRSL